HVVGDHHVGQGDGQVVGLAAGAGAGLRELLVIEERFGGAEVHGLVDELADAAARADRLVVDDHGALGDVAVDVGPGGDERCGEGGAGAGNVGLGLRGREGGGRDGGGQGELDDVLLKHIGPFVGSAELDYAYAESRTGSSAVRQGAVAACGAASVEPAISRPSRSGVASSWLSSPITRPSYITRMRSDRLRISLRSADTSSTGSPASRA